MTLLAKGYRVIWDVIEVVLRVPKGPPLLPAGSGGPVESFRPSRKFLRYLKLWFWIPTVAIDAGLLAGWTAIFIALPVLGLVLILPLVCVIVVPGVFGFVALHLRVDSTWYVLSDRSMRLRRGIWFLHETTITFENAQNVSVRQGPIERLFGIAHVAVSTAGGGGDKHGHGGGHVGLLEGLDNAEHVRDVILSRIRASRSAGLGDERSAPASGDGVSAPRWTPDHLGALREIRDRAAALGSVGK